MSEAVIIAVIGSGALSAVISGIFQVLQGKSQKEKGVGAGTRILLYDRIKYLGKLHIDKGYISMEDLEDLITMHNIYHNELKGNGYLDNVMDAVKALPLK